MTNTASADRNSSHRKIPILIAVILVVLAIFYVIGHREHHLAAVVSSRPRTQARATTITSSAAHGSAASTAASSGQHEKAVAPAVSNSLPLVIPSPTATGPATGKFLQLEAAGSKRHLEQYDPHAATDIPIVMDVMYGRVHKLSERLDAGLDPNMSFQSGSEPEYSTGTLLNYAIATGQRAVIKELVDRGASTNLGSPLIEAASLSQTDVVKFLLDHGASPNQTGVLGHTALRDAIIMGDYSMVKVLLQAVPIRIR